MVYFCNTLKYIHLYVYLDSDFIPQSIGHQALPTIKDSVPMARVGFVASSSWFPRWLPVLALAGSCEECHVLCLRFYLL